jgi:hypothetical protein
MTISSSIGDWQVGDNPGCVPQGKRKDGPVSLSDTGKIKALLIVSEKFSVTLADMKNVL